MKPRRKIVLELATVLIVTLWIFSFSPNRAQKAAEEARRTLRQQGFKTDLSEFDFSVSSKVQARAKILTNTSPSDGMMGNIDYQRSTVLQDQPNLMETISSNSAIVVWKQPILQDDTGEDAWPILREMLNERKIALDAAAEAALSGPIAFPLNANEGSEILLRHVAPLKKLTQTFGQRAVLELRDGNRDAAWTNLLAATRLVTAWNPEPVEVSHMVRYSGATVAFNSTWQTLQAGGWEEERLADLQKEWESADFLSGLPETVAFTRVGTAAVCERERQLGGGTGIPWREWISSPQSIGYFFQDLWRRRNYRQKGSYEDQRALFLHFRDREMEMQKALRAPNWLAMQPLAGATNIVEFESKHPSRALTLLNLRRVSAGFQRQGRSLLTRAAEAEARRHVLIVAIALERYRAKHYSYPTTLDELFPAFLKNPALDFIDGKSLRYRPTLDGHFLLYSIGLDGQDDGGVIRQRQRGRMPMEGFEVPTVSQNFDLAWPLPASATTVETTRIAQRNAQRQKEDQIKEQQAHWQWRNTEQRQRSVEKILAEKPKPAKEPVYHSRLVSEILRNEKSSAPANSRLSELLTLQPVITRAEPEVMTFELPVSYDALTNSGELSVLVDATSDDEFDDPSAIHLEINRATNGNCQLVWHTIYESPGKHAIQAAIQLHEMDEPLLGPNQPIVLNHICQFSAASAYFEPGEEAVLRGKLPESNGVYSVEIKTPDGEHVRTLTGQTSNSVITIRWDLKDDHGKPWTNLVFNSIFNVTLPDSGRSQIQKGP